MKMLVCYQWLNLCGLNPLEVPTSIFVLRIKSVESGVCGVFQSLFAGDLRLGAIVFSAHQTVCGDS